MTIAHLGALSPIAEQRGGDPRLLFDELLGVIRAAIADAPRSQQRTIGPSEVGQPCARQLGHKLAGTLPPDTGDKWRATVGTAVHEWLAETFRANNRAWREATGQDVLRWLVEQRVRVGAISGTDIDGNTDMYDRVTATVIDWKTASPSKLKVYRAHGPGRQYRDQCHLYARGWVTRGVPVDTVMLVFLPRNGDLREAYRWSEPYAPEIAATSLARASRIDTAVKVLGAEAYTVSNADLMRRGLPMLAEPGGEPADLALRLDFDGCRYCPLWKPGSTDPSTGCPGDSADRAPRRDALLDLIA